MNDDKNEYDKLLEDLKIKMDKVWFTNEIDSEGHEEISNEEFKKTIADIYSLTLQVQLLDEKKRLKKLYEDDPEKILLDATEVMDQILKSYHSNKIMEDCTAFLEDHFKFFKDDPEKTKALQEIILQAIENNAASTAEKTTYRTKAKAQEAGAIVDAPKNLAIPTLTSYQNSMSLYQSGGAYLQPLSSTDGLKFKNGKMYFDGEHMREVSEVELQNMKTKEGIDNIDLPILRTFYSIILTQFEKSNYKELRDVLTMSVPTLAEFIGLKSNLNKKDISRVIDKTQSYHNIVGVVHATRNGRPVQSLYPVLNFEGYDDKTNTVSFSSPYMNYVIRTVYNLSIRKTKDGKPKLKKNGKPLTLPSHSYLIDSSITKERNKAAVENVIIIVTLIEQAGNCEPHIKASTLIERNVQLSERLNSVKNPRSLLKSSFTKTWELLRSKTRLTEFYKDIKLPDPQDPAFIPTMGTLDEVVFKFPHKGKSKHINTNKPSNMT